SLLFFSVTDTPPTAIFPLSLHDALPISSSSFSWPSPGGGSNAAAFEIVTAPPLLAPPLDAPLWERLPVTRTPATISPPAIRTMTSVGTSQPRSVRTNAGGAPPDGVASACTGGPT